MEIKNIISSFTLGLINSFSISAQDTIYDEKYEQLLKLNTIYSIPSDDEKDYSGDCLDREMKQTS